MGETEQTTGADRTALVALAVSLTALAACIPFGVCLTSLAPLVVGIIALTQAKDAVNPERARLYGWIATGIGILIVLGLVVFMVLYGTVFMSTFQDIQQELPR